MDGEEEQTTEPQQIPIENLPPHQMNMLKQQLEQEVQSLQENLQGLRSASMRFGHTKDALGEMLQEGNEGREIMVPLSSSVYVDGRIAQPSRALVDVGTGYFIDQSSKGALGFCEGKIKMLEESQEKVAKIVHDKRKFLDQVTAVLSRKVMEMQQQAQLEAAK
eukprot:GEMP01059898.1.p1 GENE.GEMP01059898.1~~GEMP01059898.1.p1  ORF type:complete len:171 (+),score=52.29 GEMP01059898.1:27-515(+)